MTEEKEISQNNKIRTEFLTLAAFAAVGPILGYLVDNSFIVFLAPVYTWGVKFWLDANYPKSPKP